MARPRRQDAPEHMTAVRSYERIWVALLDHAWRSLAVVPAAAGMSAGALARGVAQVGSDYQGEPVRFVSAEGARLGGSRKLLDSLGSGAPFSCVIATDSPVRSEAALLVARNVDGVLLVVPLELARLAEVEHLVEQIGRPRILGAISVAPRSPLG